MHCQLWADASRLNLSQQTQLRRDTNTRGLTRPSRGEGGAVLAREPLLASCLHAVDLHAFILPARKKEKKEEKKVRPVFLLALNTTPSQTTPTPATESARSQPSGVRTDTLPRGRDLDEGVEEADGVGPAADARDDGVGKLAGL
eukprot:491497-Rhodomonas_salina.1